MSDLPVWLEVLRNVVLFLGSCLGFLDSRVSSSFKNLIDSINSFLFTDDSDPI